MIGPEALAVVPVAAGAWYLAPQVLRVLHQRALRRHCQSTRSVSLTFDDGPGPCLTRDLLDLLAARRARATFFVTGARAAQHPAVVDEIIAAGHELGSHGDRHVNAWRSLPWTALKDLADGYRRLSPWLEPDRLFRPPYGKTTLLTWASVRRRGARIGWWTVVGGDVEARLPPPSTAADEITRRGGGVVLLHDFDRGPARARFVLRAAELALNAAQQQKLAVRTLGELLGTPATATPAARFSRDATASARHPGRARGADTVSSQRHTVTTP